MPAETLAVTGQDHDGLSDNVEQELLLRFVPIFMVSAAGSEQPKPVARNGTSMNRSSRAAYKLRARPTSRFTATTYGRAIAETWATLWMRSTSPHLFPRNASTPLRFSGRFSTGTLPLIRRPYANPAAVGRSCLPIQYSNIPPSGFPAVSMLRILQEIFAA